MWEPEVRLSIGMASGVLVRTTAGVGTRVQSSEIRLNCINYAEVNYGDRANELRFASSI